MKSHPSSQAGERTQVVFRFSDSATSDTVSADSLSGAITKYLQSYDTAEMLEDESFEVRIFTGEPQDLMDLSAIMTVVANGKSGVKSYSISHR